MRTISRDRTDKRRRPEAAARPKTEAEQNFRDDTRQDAADFSFRNARDAPLTAKQRQERRLHPQTQAEPTPTFPEQAERPTTEPETALSNGQEAEPIREPPYTESKPLREESRPAENLPPTDFTAQTPEKEQPSAPPKQAAQHGTAYHRKFQESVRTEDSRSSPQSSSVGQETPKKESKLQFSADELSPGSPKADGKPVLRAERRADGAARKLERAENKLPARRKLRMEQTSDPESGKRKKRLRFEKKTKTQKEHLKGSLPTRPLKAGIGTAGLMLHREVYRSEQENVGLEAAHRLEMMGEGAARGVYRYHKTAPYRKVEKLQKRAAKAKANAAYKRALQENPELRKKALAKLWQKQKLKRQYAKAAREAQKAGKRAKETAVTTEKGAAYVIRSIGRHPLIWGIAILLLLLLFLISSVLGAFSGIATGGTGMVASSTYLAADGDINQAELIYTEWEADLQMQIGNAAARHFGYDEYRYQLAEIGHDPYKLMSFLSAVYRNFTYTSIQRILKNIFNDQYSLSFHPETEIRYRTEVWKNPLTGKEYTVNIPYFWNILNIQLTARNFDGLLRSRMTDPQKEAYDVLIQGKGNRQYIRNVFAFDWSGFVGSRYGWRVQNGNKVCHLGVDIFVPEGTKILAGQDGKVTLAGDTGDFGLCVALEGKDYSDQTLTTKYGHCSKLFVTTGQTVKAGDVIATVGNTGKSDSPHLHLEVLVDGVYLNPLYFADCEY